MCLHHQLARLGLLLSVCLCLGAAKPNLPEAEADQAATASNQSVLINVLANDLALGSDLRLLKAFKPGHGAAQIENGRIRYTPAAGFAGSDRFQYMVQPGEGQPRVGSVNVEVGGGGVMLTLSGQVVDSPIAGAIIHVTVGGFTFVGVAGPDGKYVMDIAALAGDGMVALRATGTSASGAPVEFVSLLGQLATLDVQAGADGVLTLAENSQVNVTHISSALYVLMIGSNGGTAPATDQQLQQALQSIDISELAELAAVIKLVVDGGEPLPAGVTSVLDLIGNPGALATFEAALDPGQLDAAIADVSDNTGALSGYASGRIPAGYAIIFPGAPGTIRVGVSGQSLLSLNGAAGGGVAGSGEWISADFIANAAQSWTLANNKLQVTFVQPRFGTGLVPNPACPAIGNSLNIQGHTARLQIERLQDGAAGVDYLNVTEFFDLSSVIDIDPSDGCLPPPLSEPMQFSYRALGFKNGQGELPYAAGEALGTQMLQHYRSQLYAANVLPDHAGWGAVLFDFDSGSVPAGCGLANAGSTTVSGLQANFCWAINAGRLLVRTIESPGGVVRQHSYRRYQSDLRKGEGVMAVVTDCQLDGGAVSQCAGPQALIYGLASRVESGLALSPDMLPGRWRSGFDISQFQPSEFEDLGFFVRLCGEANHTGEFEISFALPPPDNVFYNRPFTWAADSGRMVARSYFRNTVPRQVAACSGSDPSCSEERRREWIPIARDGDRYYLLERLYSRQPGFGNPPILVSERPNFYEVGAMTEAARCPRPIP